MAARGGCPARPAMTRTQMLRAAKTAARVQKETRPPEPPKRGPCPARGRTGLARLGPPPGDPKRINLAAPTMTRAMQMRAKAAAEKVQRIEAQQRLNEAQRQAEINRRPRRTPAPGTRQRSAATSRKTPEDQLRVLQDAISKGNIATERAGQRQTAALDTAVRRGHIVTERSGARPKRAMAGPSGLSRGPRPLATATPITEDTRELAKLMNAEVVQAVPISDGPVDKIIIDPGAVRGDRSTIVVITPDATLCDPTVMAGPSDAACRSIQAITETLDEQDAAESAAVQGKLEDLQNARREFVIAVANVGGNAVNIHDESEDSILNIDDIPDQLEFIPSPPKPRRVVQLPDVSHEMFRVEYTRDHPTIEAARGFSRRQQAIMEQRDAQRRVEDAFESVAMQQAQDLDFDVPFEQDIQEGDISWEEDEHGIVLPCPSRVKASMRIPRRHPEACPAQPGANIEQIERFMDLQNYPPTPECPGAPPGREGLPRDLWDIEDPWYFEAPVTEASPLMRFDSYC